MSQASDSQLEALGRFDTPTICNALEVVAPERRASGFTTRPLVCARPDLPPMVGYARTVSIRAVAPSPASAEQSLERRAAYYASVETAPGPTVAVVQDLDSQPGFGAFWGEVNTNVHKGLGCLGAITNGSMRDLDVLAPGFQLLAGSVGPSHAHVHIVDFAGSVEVHGMTVHPGDLVHADRHGAVVVPPEAVGDLPAAVDLIARRERVVLEAASRPDFDAAMLRRAWSEAAGIR